MYYINKYITFNFKYLCTFRALTGKYPVNILKLKYKPKHAQNNAAKNLYVFQI